jgi:hypothetical protein
MAGKFAQARRGGSRILPPDLPLPALFLNAC